MAYRSSSNTTGSTTTITLPVPTGAATDDIAIIAVNVDNQPHGTWTWPTGFTELAGTNGTAIASPDGHTQAIAWKRLTGADSGNYTITYTNGNDYVAECALFSGRDTGNPPVAATVATNTSANSSPVSVGSNGVTASDGDDLIWIGGIDVTSSGIGNGCAAPSGYQERQDVELGWSNLSIATQDNVSAGATGTVTGTYSLASGTAGWIAHLVRIPSSGGGGASGQPTSKRFGGVPGMAFNGGVWAPMRRLFMPPRTILKPA